ncbi:MAG: type IV pilin protein [Pseudomonadota bacterium]
MFRPLSIHEIRTSEGFTLIELVIVIVVVSILMAIALPAYQNSLTKGRRADAKEGLMDAANRQERFMLDRGTYTQSMADLGLGPNDPASSTEGYYTIEVEAPDANCPIANCYELKATPVAGGIQSEDTFCTSFSIKSTGAKTAEGSAATECW